MPSRRIDYSLVDEVYAVAVENLGELSWGIGVPSSIPFSYYDPLKREATHIMVQSNIMEDVFKIFYEKLKSNEKYLPLKLARDSESKAIQRIYYLENLLKERGIKYDA